MKKLILASLLSALAVPASAATIIDGREGYNGESVDDPNGEFVVRDIFTLNSTYRTIPGIPMYGIPERTVLDQTENLTLNNSGSGQGRTTLTVNEGASVNTFHGTLHADTVNLNGRWNSINGGNFYELNVSETGSMHITDNYVDQRYSADLHYVNNSGNIVFDFGGANALGPSMTELYNEYTQHSGSTTINNQFYLLNGTEMNINGGVLKGAGAIYGTVNINDGAALNAGNSPGHLTFAGDLTIAEGAELILEVDGTGAHDEITVEGTLELLGDIVLTLIDGATLDTLANLTIDDFFTFDFDFTGVDMFVDIDGALSSVSLDSEGNFVAGPVSVSAPATFAMFALGLFALVAQRKRATA